MCRCVFYCDIEGTFNSNDNSCAKRQKELQEFANTLDLLCEVNDKDEILFSFVSSSSISCIIEKVEEFSDFVKNSKHIKFGTSYSDKEKIIGEDINSIFPCDINGKVFQIIENIQYENNDNVQIKKIDKIYFADDSIFQHQMLDLVFSKFFDDSFDVVHLIPGKEFKAKNAFYAENKELLGVINSINKYIEREQIEKFFC